MKPTVCLTMIVKNENSPHLLECLDSVLPIINCYSICDTGSTDGTQDFIREYFASKNIPGEIHDIPWEGFGICRTKALKSCDGKADYAFMIDADDRIVGTLQFPENTIADAYQLRLRRGEYAWWRSQIFKTGIGWHYVGVLHEYANCEKKPLQTARLSSENYYMDARTLGARNQDDDKNPITGETKYVRDAETLIDALQNPENPNYSPNNPRYLFYVGQSYFDAGKYPEAIEWYQKRIENGGWEEETYYSMYRLAIAKSIVGETFANIVQYYMNAWEFRPTRVEPLFQIARLYRINGKPRSAFIFAHRAASMPKNTQDILFIPTAMYAWQMDDELAATAFYAHEVQIGLDASQRLINNPHVPAQEKDRIQRNHESYKTAIAQIAERVEEMQTKALQKNEEYAILEKQKREQHRKAADQKRHKNKKRKVSR